MRFIPVLLLGFAVWLWASSAYAACSNPPGEAGDLIFNEDFKVVQWCDGDNWYAAGGGSGSDTLSGLTCADGQIVAWNAGGSAWECIDGSNADTLAGLSCTDGQIPSWDAGGSAWVCAAMAGGGGGTGGPDGCENVGDVCPSGSAYGDGVIYAGSYGGYWYFTTAADNNSGQNWTNANSTCNGLTDGGLSDWYLPDHGQLQFIYSNKNEIGGFSSTGYYWTGSGNTTDAWYIYFGNGQQFYQSSSTNSRVRCVRRDPVTSGGGGADNLGDHTATQDIEVAAHNLNAVGRIRFNHVSGGLPPPLSYGGGGGGGGDTTPDSFSFTDQSGVATGVQITSNSVTISGLGSIAVASVSGDGSPQIRIGGGSWVTSGLIGNGQSIEVRLTSGGANTMSTATVDIGGVTDDWVVSTMNITISQTDTGATTGWDSSWSFSANIGTPSADRRVLVTACFGFADGYRYVDAISVGGVSATMLRRANNPSNSYSARCEVWMAHVPTGTTATISGNTNTNTINGGFRIYEIHGLSTNTPFDADNIELNGSSSSPSLTVDTASGNLIFAVASSYGSATWACPAGYDSYGQIVNPYERNVVCTKAASGGSETINPTISGTEDKSMAVVVLE
ncbi:MAG: DUF1566 domain-containing protein [Rhodomicrobium sp.]|nr:DUF1566 domain-containing protein [Rhodomicrobium sp.]